MVVRFLSAILRHKWLILAAGVGGVGAGVVASRFVHPTYVAEGRILIPGAGRGNNNNQGPAPIRAGQLLQSYEWVQLLKTYAVLDPTVVQLRLFISPKAAEDQNAFRDFELKEKVAFGTYRFLVSPDRSGWLLVDRQGTAVQRGKIGDKVGEPAGFIWTPPPAALRAGREIEFDVNLPRDISRGLRDQIVPSMLEDGGFLLVSLEGTSPTRVTYTLNGVMNRFVEVAAQLKSSQLDTLTSILDQQRRTAEEYLASSEAELEAFKIETITLPSGEGSAVAGGIQLTTDPVFSNFFDMKVTREDLRRDRVALDEILAQVAAGTLTLNALATVSSTTPNGELARMLGELATQKATVRDLQTRYTDIHFDVQPRLAAIETLQKQTIPAAVRDLQAQIAAKERELDLRLGSASAELKQIPPRTIEDARLRRRVATAENLHGMLRQRFEEARLAALSSGVPDVMVLDTARVPFAPLNDTRSMVIAGFGAGAVGLALLGVLLRDRADRRVRYPEQITAGMGLPILGAIPRVKGGLNNRDPYAAAQLSEAFRELRFAIVHAHGAAGPLLLSVTSPDTGDGKSTVAGSLAAVFAGQGHRVILIDADIRRGDLHRSTGCSRSPGLTDYLAGKAQLEEILQPVEDRGFTLIGSGTRMQAGPELLGSPAMSHLLRNLRSQFSVIIVDTPPLGAGVDAYVLGTATGNMIMVLRTGYTDSELAEAKLTLLDRLPVRVLGAVLNDVPPSRIYRYYSYLPGYSAEDEGPAPLQVAGITGGNDSRD